MMGILNALSPRASSKTNSVTMLAFGVVFLVLGICGVWYWQYVETQILHLQERNFRALAVTSHALGKMVTNYGMIFNSVIKGEPPCNKEYTTPCLDKPTRSKAYKDAVEALPDLHDVTVAEETKDRDGFSVRFVTSNGDSAIQLTFVDQDRTGTKTRWKIKALINISTIMQELVIEDIFPDVLLADHMGQVLYHHQSARDVSGFEFKGVSSLLHRRNHAVSKDGGAEKSVGKEKEDLVSNLPLFNEAPIGGISHAIFAQATDLLLDQETVQTLILVGIVPARQFHVEARAIPLNPLLLLAGLLLTLFFLLPYVKLRTNEPTERLTPISVAVLVVSSFLGIAVLTFGLADFATYHNLEQHLDRQLEEVSKEIVNKFNEDVYGGLNQLMAFDESCNLDCWRGLRNEPGKPHLTRILCIEKNDRSGFVFLPAVDHCSGSRNQNSATDVVYPDVKYMFWVGSTGELKVLQSRESASWKYANLQKRQYIRRIWEDETLIRRDDKRKFWIEPIFSLTTGDNASVLSMKSWLSPEGRNPNRPIVAALEVKLPSVTNVSVPPGMGFAVIDQEGEVLFHSDARRNLRENLFEETDRDGRLQQAVFARATDQFDGRYWGKDRHFHITPLFSTTISESPDVHWSLVAYWDTDMLRALNLRALYSSAVLFLIYGIIALIIVIPVWWISSRPKEAANRWVWPQSEHLQRYQIAMLLLVFSLLAVSIWYLRPHPAPEMLVWGLLPALASAVLVLSIPQTETDPTDKNNTEVSAQQRYRLAYALVVTLILLSFVVLPALVSFRVAIDVEWRLLAKFALYDLGQDRDIQTQKVRRSYPSALFHEPYGSSEVRNGFLQNVSEHNVVYDDFPFERCQQERQNCREVPPPSKAQRGDERLIQWLYQYIERPRLGASRDETGIFLKESEFLKAPEQRFESGLGTLRLGDHSHAIPSSIPQWLYALLVFGGLLPLAVLRFKKNYAFAAVMCVLGGFLWFELVGALAVLTVCALLYATCHALPTFAAKRVFLLDFPYPPMESSVVAQVQESAGMGKDFKQPDGWSVDSWAVFVKERSGLCNALRWTEIPWRDELIKSLEKQDLKDNFDVVKERIIREFERKAADQYLEMWKKRTASEHRSLFNLARDGFLHAKNPDITPLLENGLIVADLNLRPMNESFRRFIIRTGRQARLDEDIAQAKTGMWFQVWRPIGVGLVLIMVFLVLTQDQYRQITLAFLGVLPALLGVLSQALTSSKKEKLETVASA